MSLHRLFVAIVPPRAIRDRLLAAMGGVGGARWQSDEQLHLTLRFIGEVDRHAAGDIAAALGNVHVPPFTLTLGAPGCFERGGRPEALWMGVAPHDDVAALAQRVDRALLHAGIAAETRAFLPHITVARLNRHAGPVAGWLTSPPLIDARFEVKGFTLFESTLGRAGADYLPLEVYGRQGFAEFH